MKHYDRDKKSIEEVYEHQLDTYSDDLYGKLFQHQRRKLDSDWENRSKYEKAKNLTYFRWAYLGPGNLLDQDADLTKTLNYNWYRTVDKELCAENNDGTPLNRYLMILVAPGWGKTFGYTIAYCIQQLCLNRKIKILIVSKSSTRASEFMNAIQKTLKYNQKIQRDFGGIFFDPRNKWNSQRIEVVGSAKMEASYSISNQGYYSQLEGARPNLIICDDPLDQQTAESVAGVQRFLRAFTSTVEPRLEPAGQLLFITHRFSTSDGLDDLLNSNYFNGKYNGKSMVIPAVDNIGRSTNPQRWPEVTVRKAQVGTFVWETEYMQNPVSRGDCPFELEWISPPDPDIDVLRNRNKAKWVNIKPDHIDLSIDPSWTVTEHSDYTGAVALGPHPTDKHGLIITHMFAIRIGSGFTTWYINTLDLVKGKKIYIEIDGAGDLPDSFDSVGFHNYEVIHARKAKKLRIGDLDVCFESTPDTKMEKKKFRFYFHVDLLHQPSGLLDHNKMPIPVWKIFENEFTTWNSESKTHEHILDSIAGYVVKKRPWSRRRPKTVSSSSRGVGMYNRNPYS